MVAKTIQLRAPCGQSANNQIFWTNLRAYADRASFARVVPIQSAAADLFYDRLFAISPKLRELFPADLRGQKRKLMQMISTAVGGLTNLNQLVPAVKTLGARHSG